MSAGTSTLRAPARLRRRAPRRRHTAALFSLVTLCAATLAATGCHRGADDKPEPARPQERTQTSAKAVTAHFDSPRAVFAKYAEALNAYRWADAIALFTPSGKAGLVLANFKALALLAATQHPKQAEYKAVLHELCQSHGLRCAAEGWSATFAAALLAHDDVTNMISDVASLAAAEPEQSYAEVMKLLQGVDANAVVPLEPTLTQVIYTGDKATGIARRADGKTSTMAFMYTAEHGWMLAQ